MKFIPHFSVYCANIGFFCETTKFFGEFLILVLISHTDLTDSFSLQETIRISTLQRHHYITAYGA